MALLALCELFPPLSLHTHIKQYNLRGPISLLSGQFEITKRLERERQILWSILIAGQHLLALIITSFLLLSFFHFSFFGST